MINLISKITLSVILLFLLAGCRGYYNINPWIEESVAPRCSTFWSSRQFHSSSTMEMDIVTDHCDTRVYLNLMICPVEPDNPESQTINFDYWVEGVSFTGRAFVLKGGQRLLLDNDASEIILTALRSGNAISISLNMYQDVLFDPF